MRAPALVFLSSLLMVDVWAAPPRQRITNEPSSTGPSTEVAPAVSLEPPADAAPPPPHTLSSLGRRSLPEIEIVGMYDYTLRSLARDHPQFAQPLSDYKIHAINQKHMVEARLEDPNFCQCMLRRLNLKMRPPRRRELPVGDLDLFRSAFLCQFETVDFGFTFPHVKRFFPGRANEPVGYREEDLAKAAESMRFHVPAPLARLYSGFQKDFQKDVRSLERPLGRALLSWERAAPKRMMPTAAESWRFTSELP
ncbi:MAG: hypothetical protein M1826_006052 [Phylliscum demangeonii]|nr:MAG: hypothetical protein M1826_006052 [Phylliscum demangeonii]